MQHGKSVSHKTGKVTSVFRCGRYRETDRRECSIHTIKETVLHDAVLAQIKLQIQLMADMAQRVKCNDKADGIGAIYLDIGEYLEQIFPFLGVRFISVNDVYDSDNKEGTAGD